MDLYWYDQSKETSNDGATMSEAAILKLVMLEASRLGMTIFRNNTGAIKVEGRYISYGLHKGSSDLIGWTSTGKFVAIEVKAPEGRPTPEQVNFIEQVRDAGGFGCIINDEKKLEWLFNNYLKNAKQSV